jgi:hypothetical protein
MSPRTAHPRSRTRDGIARTRRCIGEQGHGEQGSSHRSHASQFNEAFTDSQIKGPARRAGSHHADTDPKPNPQPNNTHRTLPNRCRLRNIKQARNANRLINIARESPLGKTITLSKYTPKFANNRATYKNILVADQGGADF